MSPSELEGLILTHPAVADVAVVGKPDSLAGELPMAWVVTKPGHTVTETDIVNFVAGYPFVLICTTKTMYICCMSCDFF